MYDYKVVWVDRVVDGDTVDVTIDVGFRMTTQQRIRVLGINTPERGQPRWAEAREFTLNWLLDRVGQLRIQTHKADSFGRYLGEIYLAGDLDHTLTAALLEAGYSKYEG